MLVSKKTYNDDNGNIGYVESIYKSSNVLMSTYFPHKKLLYISFGRGGVYSYGNVNMELYNEFENADSQGVFFKKHLSDKNKYYCRKEFTLYPGEVEQYKLIVENYIDDNEDENK